MNMTLLPYDLTFKDPIHIHDSILESKNGFILKIERDNITSYADVSPLEHLSTETYKDVHIDCKKINTTQIFSDIDSYLKKETEKLFLEDKFLDFDFSKYTQLPSLKHALSCLFSDYYRRMFGIKILGHVSYHGLIPNSLIKAPPEEAVKKAVHFEKFGFKKAKLKIGSDLSLQGLQKENILLSKILSETKHLKLRLDANRKFKIEDYHTLFKNIDTTRIDYIEEPVKKTSELLEFFSQVHVPIGIDENLKLLKDVNFVGTTAAIIKPTLVGDFYTIKRLVKDFRKRGISAVLSSSFESQVGIYQIAQLAYAMNPKETHGLDTFDCFLENLMDLNTQNGAITLRENLELKGPLYV